jgi:L,D-transpeptidase catalytic domain
VSPGSHFRRGALLRTASVMAFATGAVATPVAGAAGLSVPPAPPAQAAAGPAVGGPTGTLAWTARIVVRTAVRPVPDAAAPPRSWVEPVAHWNGGTVRLLVLDSRIGDDDRRWLKVRLPGRPNGGAGWIDADAARLSPTSWRVEIDLRARRGAAFHAGRRVRTWSVVIGERRTPTPRGLFAVYERVRQPAGSELGTWALHITAHSDVLFDYGGGLGRVALHGRAGPLLIAPLGSAASHGCVRMDNAVISWLAARAGPGTPVRIR